MGCLQATEIKYAELYIPVEGNGDSNVLKTQEINIFYFLSKQQLAILTSWTLYVPGVWKT